MSTTGENVQRIPARGIFTRRYPRRMLHQFWIPAGARPNGNRSPFESRELRPSQQKRNVQSRLLRRRCVGKHLRARAVVMLKQRPTSPSGSCPHKSCAGARDLSAVRREYWTNCAHFFLERPFFRRSLPLFFSKLGSDKRHGHASLATKGRSFRLRQRRLVNIRTSATIEERCNSEVTFETLPCFDWIRNHRVRMSRAGHQPLDLRLWSGAQDSDVDADKHRKS